MRLFAQPYCLDICCGLMIPRDRVKRCLLTTWRNSAVRPCAGTPCRCGRLSGYPEPFPGGRDHMIRVSRPTGPNKEDRMVRAHQPGAPVFRSVLPEDIEQKPFPAFPPSVRLAVVVGRPSEPGPYVIRVKVPSGVKLMPHRHPEDRIYTVMSGVFYVGLGDRFDGDKVAAYPPG